MTSKGPERAQGGSIARVLVGFFLIVTPIVFCLASGIFNNPPVPVVFFMQLTVGGIALASVGLGIALLCGANVLRLFRLLEILTPWPSSLRTPASIRPAVSVIVPVSVYLGENLIFDVQARSPGGREIVGFTYSWEVTWLGEPVGAGVGKAFEAQETPVRGRPGRAILRIYSIDPGRDPMLVAKAVFEVKPS